MAKTSASEEPKPRLSMSAASTKPRANRGRADWTEIVFNRISGFRYAGERSDLAVKFFEVGILNRDRNAIGTAGAPLACIAVAKLSI